MQKLLKISLVFVLLLLAVATTVNAISADDLVAYVTKAQEVAGKKVVLVSASQKVEIERYLSKNEVSESDLDYVKSKFDEAVKILNKAGTTDVKKLSSSVKDELIALVEDVSANTSIKATVNANGTITVYNLDGTKFDTVTPIIKQTGSTNYAYIPVIAIVAVAIVFFTKKGLASAK